METRKLEKVLIENFKQLEKSAAALVKALDNFNFTEASKDDLNRYQNLMKQGAEKLEVFLGNESIIGLNNQSMYKKSYEENVNAAYYRLTERLNEHIKEITLELKKPNTTEEDTAKREILTQLKESLKNYRDYLEEKNPLQKTEKSKNVSKEFLDLTENVRAHTENVISHEKFFAENIINPNMKGLTELDQIKKKFDNKFIDVCESGAEVVAESKDREATLKRLHKGGYDNVISFPLMDFITVSTEKKLEKFKKILDQIENNDPKVMKLYDKKALYASKNFDIDRLYEQLETLELCLNRLTEEKRTKKLALMFMSTGEHAVRDLEKTIKKIEQQVTQEIKFAQALDNSLPPLPITPKNNVTREEQALWRERKVTPPKTSRDFETPENISTVALKKSKKLTKGLKTARENKTNLESNPNSSNSSRDPTSEKKQKNLTHRKFTIGKERGTLEQPHTLEKFGITHDFVKPNSPSTRDVESQKTEEVELTFKSPRKK